MYTRTHACRRVRAHTTPHRTTPHDTHASNQTHLARFLQFAVVLVTGYISCSNNTLIIVIMIGVIIIVTVVGVDTVIAHLVLCICVEAGRLSAAATVTLAAVSSSVHILGVGMWLRVAAVSIIVVMGVVIVLRALVRARECRHGVCHGPSCSVLQHIKQQSDMCNQNPRSS